MVAIMRGAMGVGLAATQLGALRRLLVFQAGRGRARRPPSSTRRSSGSPTELATAEEGCLSLPGIGLDVERALHARVSGVDVEGEPLLLEASGLEARVLQHEIDHLDGVLILDRTDARAAQGGAAGAARGHQLQPGARSRARRRVRVVYLGTSDFAAAVLRAARRHPAPPGARGHAARPPPRPRAPHRAGAGRRGRRGARDRRPAHRVDRERRGARSGSAPPSPSWASSAPSASCCASRC